MALAKRKHRASDSPEEPMTNTLYLTKAEQKFFAALPDALREGWKIEEEKLTFTDDENRARMRYDMMRVKAPEVAELKAFAQGGATPDEIVERVQAMDLSAISDNDLGELLFAIGPSGVTMLIGVALQGTISTDDDVRQLASLTEVRHGLLKALSSVTA